MSHEDFFIIVLFIVSDFPGLIPNRKAFCRPGPTDGLPNGYMPDIEYCCITKAITSFVSKEREAETMEVAVVDR